MLNAAGWLRLARRVWQERSKMMAFFRGDPEELKAHQERQAMAREDYLQAVERFFAELTIEHLVTLAHIFNNMTQMPSPRQYANYLQGITVGVLQHVHHVCPGCGKDHAKELLGSDCKPEPEGRS